MHPLLKIVKYKNEHQAVGIYSACTANELALIACLRAAKASNSVLLIEATANQVDQYGGYTGMKPIDFYNFIKELADKEEFPMDKIILGGDHLGPLTFNHMEEEQAMAEADVLVREFVLAGFTKIHLDTSMKVASDDKDAPLATEVIARRGARLAKICEEAFKELKAKNPNALHPVYVIGSEVPIPGGAQEEEEELQVTTVADLDATIATFKAEFDKLNLDEAWKHVIAVVVQPGVEFGDTTVHEYNREKAKKLMAHLDNYPNLVFEGHSTDYQTKYKLREMVEDSVGILKVGPGLTFALREGLFALANIEKALIPIEQQSHLIEVIEEEMMKEPKKWQKHYHGNEIELAFKRKYSFSDRIRYYLPHKEIEIAIEKLFDNLTKHEIPFSLLSQYMPIQYTKVREGKLKLCPRELAIDRVVNCVDEYLFATHQEKLND